MAESFKACCQWALLIVQIITLLFNLLYISTFNLMSGKVHAGSFRNPPNSDMDYRICKRAYGIILMRAYIHAGGWAHRQRVSTRCLTRIFDWFVCSWRRSNLGSWDLESKRWTNRPVPGGKDGRVIPPTPRTDSLFHRDRLPVSQVPRRTFHNHYYNMAGEQRFAPLFSPSVEPPRHHKQIII